MDWDARYQASDTPWDKGSATPVLPELITKLPSFFVRDTSVIMPGCGRGHDALPFLEAGMHVTGLDVSAQALEHAAQAYGSNERLQWLTEDLFAMPAEHLSHYDMVWEHTCYCAIPPSMREAYVDAVSDLLLPNAYFVGVFYIDTGKPPEEGPPFSTTREQVFHNFERKFQLIWEGRPTQAYPGREGCEWTMIWRKPITEMMVGI